MANVTRIKNNQITDSTITYAKIVPGTLVGSLFNENLTLNSNISIIGNLSVTGVSSAVSSTNTYVNDPLVVFNNGYTGSLTGYDIGILVNRNLSVLSGYSGGVNTAWIWSEADSAFVALVTTDTGGGITSLNNSGYANIKLGNLTATNATLSGSLSATSFTADNFYGNLTSTTGVITNFSTGNAQITGGSITGVSGTFTTLYVQNFSTGNAWISGGYADNFPIGANTKATGGFTTLVTTGDITAGGNITITGNIKPSVNATYSLGSSSNRFKDIWLSGSTLYIDSATMSTDVNGNLLLTTGIGNQFSLSNVSPNTANFSANIVSPWLSGNVSGTNVNTTNLNATTGVITNVSGTGLSYGTGVFTNFSSGNAVISGGSAQGLSTLQATNFSTGNAMITGGTVSGISGSATTLVVTNFSTGNAWVSGGYADNFPIGANTAAAGKFTNVTDTALTATRIVLAGTGGLLEDTSGLTFSSNTLNANNVTTNGTVTALSTSTTNLTATTGVITNFSTGNAQITGGSISGVGSLSATTLYVQNFSTGNAWISGGYADNFPIGANTAATGNFTTLDASGIVHFTNTTQAISHDTAAVILEGGLGVQKDVYINGNLYVANVIASVNNTISVTDPLLYLTATSTYPYDYDIGVYSQFTGGPANVYAHTGIVRNHLTAEWAFFSNIATEPNGTIPFSDTGTIYDAIKAGQAHLVNTTVSSSTTTGALVVDGGVGIAGKLYASEIFAVSINNTPIGNTTPSTGRFTDLYAQNFSTGNAVISGGSAQGLTTLQATNFSTGNAMITGGTVSGISGSATTLVVTNFSTGNAQITGGSINAELTGNISATYGTFTNLSTGNAYLTGGTVSGISGSATTLAVTNFSTGNAMITGGTVSGVSGSATTLVVTNLSSGNAVISGGSAQGLTTLQATNFSTGNAMITGGTVSGISGSATTLVVTNFSTANAQITGGTISADITGNINSSYGTITNFATSNAQITGGAVSGISGSATTLVVTNLSSGNAVISGGSLNSTPIGATTASSGVFTTLGATGQVYISDTTEATTSNIGALVVAGGVAVNKVIVAGGNILAAATTDSTSTTTGSFVAKGGVGIAGNVFLGKGLTVNSGQVAGGDFKAEGVNSTTLIWARPNSSYDQVLIGNTATTATLVPGAKLQINSTDSILLPVGTNGQRPSGVGQTDVAGMFRFSTTSNSIEWYDGTQWANASTTFTVISDEQFNGDGSQVNFTLSEAATTNGIIVSINGVLQIPTLAYAVGGVGNTTLTFTEAPAIGDVIDVRKLTTTQSVEFISSDNGLMQVKAVNSQVQIITGSGGSSSVTTAWNTTGAQVNSIANVTIATSGVATTVDSFDKTVYRSAKYIIQASIAGSYHAQEVLVVHDGSSATIVAGTAAVTGSSLGTPTATISGSNVLLQFNAANNNTNVRIKKDYIII